MNNIANDYYKKYSIVSASQHNPNGQHVALLYGGMSAEYEVSKMSGQAIHKVLLQLGYNVTLIDMGADISNVVASINPDIVFNALHGSYGEDGHIQAILNMLKIPYTHSGLLASAAGFNKIVSKHLFEAHNINTAEYMVVHKADGQRSDPMPRPYVIKPIAQGSSKGVIVVFEGDDFNFSDYDFEYGDHILVEKYIKGREINVAVLNSKALGALEIQVDPSKRFYDYEVKYTDGLAVHIMPAKLSADKYNHLLTLSEKAYRALGCRGIARLEFIYDEVKDEFFVLEINTHPGFTELSICPEIAAYVGIDLKQLVQQILDSAAYDEC